MSDICIYVYNTNEKNKKLHMINKIFSYFRRGIPSGWERKEKRRKGRRLVVLVGAGGGERKGKDGMRTDENGVRKTYEG